MTRRHEFQRVSVLRASADCPHDCPCDAPKRRVQSQRQPIRATCEVVERERFARKNEDGREADRRLANRCLRPFDRRRSDTACNPPGLTGSRSDSRLHVLHRRDRRLELVVLALSKSFGRQRYIDVRFYAFALDDRSAQCLPDGGRKPQHKSMADREVAAAKQVVLYDGSTIPM